MYFIYIYIYIYILLIDILIVNLNVSKYIYYVCECILKVLECFHNVVKPKYFYKPLLLICWINPELPSPATRF
jgi:hypothetical protein